MTDMNAWREQRAALRRFVGRRVADRHEAEDVVQDTLLRAWEAREHLRSPERMPAWLGRIAAHRIVDLHRARRPQVELPEELAAAEHEQDPVAELAPCLERFVDQLRGRWQGPVVLHLAHRFQQALAQRLDLGIRGVAGSGELE